MIKIPKKVTFILMIFMVICFVLSIRSIDWQIIKKGTNVFSEINLSITFFIMTIYFLVYYVKTLKEEKQTPL